MKDSDRGELAEAMVIAELKKNSFTVLEPFGHEQGYDLVAEIDGDFIRIQVKSGRLYDGSVRTTLCTYGSGEDGKREFTEDEIEYFGIYCPETDDVYFADVNDTPQQLMHLRVDDVKRETSRIRWAEDYTAEKVLM